MRIAEVMTTQATFPASFVVRPSAVRASTEESDSVEGRSGLDKMYGGRMSLLVLFLRNVLLTTSDQRTV